MALILKNTILIREQSQADIDICGEDEVGKVEMEEKEQINCGGVDEVNLFQFNWTFICATDASRINRMGLFRLWLALYETEWLWAGGIHLHSGPRFAFTRWLWPIKERSNWRDIRSSSLTSSSSVDALRNHLHLFNLNRKKKKMERGKADRKMRWSWGIALWTLLSGHCAPYPLQRNEGI